MKIVKLAGVIGLALVAAFAISATASASTGWQFKAATYPVKSVSSSTNFHGFEIAGATSVCKKAEFKSGEEGAPNPAGPQTTLEVHPQYKECEILLGGVAKAIVNTTGCNYLFHVAEPRSKAGTTDIVCQAGKKIEVVDEGIAGCVIEVPAQTGIKGIDYINEQPKDKVNAETNNITYKASSACGLVIKEGTNGVYREGVFNPLPALAPAGKPATALSEGLTELSEPDLVSVSQGAGNADAVHWQVNKVKLAVGTIEPTIAWGTLTLSSAAPAGNVTCKTAQAGNAINQASTEAHSEVVALTAYECKTTGGECPPPNEPRVSGLNLNPGAWGSFMMEEGGVELEEAFRSEVKVPPANQIKVAVECVGAKPSKVVFVSGPSGGPEGTSTPAWLNGTTATKPSEVSYDAKSGHLQAEGTSMQETTTGKVKVVGYVDNSATPLITLASNSGG